MKRTKHFMQKSSVLRWNCSKCSCMHSTQCIYRTAITHRNVSFRSMPWRKKSHKKEWKVQISQREKTCSWSRILLHLVNNVSRIMAALAIWLTLCIKFKVFFGSEMLPTQNRIGKYSFQIDHIFFLNSDHRSIYCLLFEFAYNFQLKAQHDESIWHRYHSQMRRWKKR